MRVTVQTVWAFVFTFDFGGGHEWRYNKAEAEAAAMQTKRDNPETRVSPIFPVVVSYGPNTPEMRAQITREIDESVWPEAEELMLSDNPPADFTLQCVVG